MKKIEDEEEGFKVEIVVYINISCFNFIVFVSLITSLGMIMSNCVLCKFFFFCICSYNFV